MPLIFYCLTGILLNHRRQFGYFVHKVRQERDIPPADTSALKDFLEGYKARIGCPDDPRVIRIHSDGRIEFLYGPHGQTTYIIDPQGGRMEIVQKKPRQPFFKLNALHQVAPGVAHWWAWGADVLALLILVLSLSGLLITKLSFLDYILLVSGGLVLLALIVWI